MTSWYTGGALDCKSKERGSTPRLVSKYRAQVLLAALGSPKSPGTVRVCGALPELSSCLAVQQDSPMLVTHYAMSALRTKLYGIGVIRNSEDSDSSVIGASPMPRAKQYSCCTSTDRLRLCEGCNEGSTPSSRTKNTPV